MHFGYTKEESCQKNEIFDTDCTWQKKFQISAVAALHWPCVCALLNIPLRFWVVFERLRSLTTKKSSDRRGEIQKAICR